MAKRVVVVRQQRPQSDPNLALAVVGVAGVAGGYYAWKKGYLDGLIAWLQGNESGNGNGDGCVPPLIYNPATGECGLPPTQTSFLLSSTIYGDQAYPLSGATVKLKCRGNIPGECTNCPCVAGAEYTAVTKVDGVAKFENIPNGFYDATVSAPGYLPKDTTNPFNPPAFKLDYSTPGGYYQSFYLLVKEVPPDPTPVTIHFDKPADTPLSVGSCRGCSTTCQAGCAVTVNLPATDFLWTFVTASFLVTDICGGCVCERLPKVSLYAKVNGVWQGPLATAEGAEIKAKVGWNGLVSTLNMYDVQAIRIKIIGWHDGCFPNDWGDHTRKISRLQGTIQQQVVGG